MSKYEPLGQELKKRNSDRIKMTFAEIEDILNAPLPDYMKKHPAGWYGTADGSPTHKQKEAWHNHGYMVETVDLNKKEATFIKLGLERQRKERQRASEIDINKMVVVLLWAGKYVQTRTGHELFNLTKNPVDGKFYGNCPESNSMPIHKFGAKNADKSIDGILVVYVKKKDNSSDYEIIGFAPNATVFRDGQLGAGLSRTFIDTNGQEEISGYSVMSDTLYNLEGRVNKFIIKKTKDSNPFRNQRIYAEQHPDLLKQIAAYVESIMEGKEILDDDIDEQDEIQRAEPATQKEIEGSADRPLTIVSGMQGKGVGKDSRYSKASLVAAKFKCQAGEHETFITKAGKPYMEGHHLIPCTLGNAQYFQEKYGKNIDCVENIVCICPTCHRAVHFGDEQTKTKILKKLYAQQAEKLHKAGILITEEELLELYKK